jgi:hypothetical protein
MIWGYKMKKIKKKSNWQEQGEIIILLTAIVLLPYISYEFAMSFHNIDLIMNFKTITAAINDAGFINPLNQTLVLPFSEIQDTGSDYVSRPLDDYYISSANNLKKYFFVGLVDILLIGLLLGRRLK